MLPDQFFVDTLVSLMVFATTFENDYLVPFVEAKMTEIAQDLPVSNFIPAVSLASYMRHVRIAKFVLRKSLSFHHVESTAASTFAATHLDNKLLASCLDSDAVLL